MKHVSFKVNVYIDKDDEHKKENKRFMFCLNNGEINIKYKDICKSLLLRNQVSCKYETTQITDQKVFSLEKGFTIS